MCFPVLTSKTNDISSNFQFFRLSEVFINYHIKNQTKSKKYASTGFPFKNLNSYSEKLSKNLTKTNCSIYPNTLDIKFSNKYWQIFSNNGSTFHLYGAYLGKMKTAGFYHIHIWAILYISDNFLQSTTIIHNCNWL